MADSTIKVLNEVRTSSKQCLETCNKLSSSLPGGPGQLGSADWPQLLGQFKVVSAQLSHFVDMQQLEHTVAIPTHPAALPDGRPTLVVPDLLRTKRVPEQEAAENEVRELVKPFLPEESLPKDERESQAQERLAQMREVVDVYNKSIDAVMDNFLASKSRNALKRKMHDTVTEFSAKKTKTRPQTGIDMLAYLHTGLLKPTLVAKTSKPPAPASATTHAPAPAPAPAPAATLGS
mmetsp:Transcript_1775/g.2804  ORF Transcript_1775/g.2804 Transcript_1775/m.2804 type:complete len:234 (-) Transcript_1775:503-1204(-)|eukprot:CAMPEP_0184553246 /NCGR_PEP_ID=MMETSP0199_2-20130426/31361_1 /TAXON_ID=1112570 /ORGANISM="Thraustochytrium sp., Strain LLF1b" /LENGTH=233 /DNA_ID=CAMNT_0026948943 /DNA_START=55 /DNA_END=756 /DNA_ORIENTATION=+